MKINTKIFKKTSVFVLTEISAAVFFSLLLVLLVAWPKFNSWLNLRSENSESEKRLDQITKNINLLKNTNASELSSYKTVVDLFLPSENDLIRFSSLAENVAYLSGMSVSAAQYEEQKVVATSRASGATGASSPSVSSDTSSGTGGTNAARPITLTAKQPSKDLEMKVSFSGSFASLLRLLANFEKTDRLYEITNLAITAVQDEQGPSEATTAITFKLPLFTNPPAASADTPLELSSDDTTFITGLIGKVVISAAPAKGKSGRKEPFK